MHITERSQSRSSVKPFNSNEPMAQQPRPVLVRPGSRLLV